MELVLFAVAIGVLLCIGAAAESTVRVEGLTSGERAAMAILLGCVVVAVLSFFSRLMPEARTATALLLGVAGACAAYRLHTRGVTLRGWASRLGHPALLCWAVVLTPLLVLLALRPLGWDALFVWAMKSRAIVASEGQVPLWYFSDVTRGWSHPDYPMQLPLLQAWVYDCLGREHQVYGKMVTGLFLVAGLPLLFGSTRRLTGRWVYGVAVIAMAVTTPQVVLLDGGALSGYVDFPLAVVYCAAAVALYGYTEQREVSAAYLTSALVCSLATLKSEGAILGAAVAIVGTAHALRLRQYRVAAALAGPFALMVIGWRAFLRSVDALQSQDFVGRSLGEIYAQHAWPVIGRELVRELTNISRWSLLWPLVATGLLVGFTRSQTRRWCLTVAALTAGPVALFQVAYLFSAWDPLLPHIQASLPRLLLQVAPLALVGAAYGVGGPGARSREAA